MKLSILITPVLLIFTPKTFAVAASSATPAGSTPTSSINNDNVKSNASNKGICCVAKGCREC
jgi:hypothetical protein